MSEFIFKRMKRYKEVVQGKGALEAMLLIEMQKKFPNLVSVMFQDNKISIETQKHVMSLYSWGSLRDTEPEFVCTDRNMPDTVEEFIKMKAFVEEDYKQCYTAFFWLFNRYNFGYYRL